MNLKICLSLIFLMLCYCNSKAQDHLQTLIGKWKNVSVDRNQIIEIRSDSILNVYSYDHPGKLKLKIEEVQKDFILVDLYSPEKKPAQADGEDGASFQILKKEERGNKKWDYSLKDSLLTFVSGENKEKEILVNCNTGICDLQKDFFSHCFVDIDLLVLDSLEHETFSVGVNDIEFYLGTSISPYSFHLEGMNFWYKGKFVETWMLASDIAFRPEIEEQKDFRVIGYVDQNAPMDLLFDLFTELARIDKKELYFAIRKNRDVSQELEISLIKVVLNPNEEMEKDLKFGAWLEEKISR